MPASKSPFTYPAEFFDIADAIAATPRGEFHMTIPFATPAKARSTQRLWYYWRTALRKAETAQSILAAAERVITRVEGNELVLTEKSEIREALAQALRAAASPTHSPADSPAAEQVSAQDEVIDRLFHRAE